MRRPQNTLVEMGIPPYRSPGPERISVLVFHENFFCYTVVPRRHGFLGLIAGYSFCTQRSIFFMRFAEILSVEGSPKKTHAARLFALHVRVQRSFRALFGLVNCNAATKLCALLCPNGVYLHLGFEKVQNSLV